MKWPTFFACLLALATGCVTGVSKPPQPSVAETRVTIELQDGSRLIGRPTSEKLEFVSPDLGVLKLRFNQMRVVQWTPKTAEARIRTVSGDEFQAKLVETELRIKTAYGEVKLPATLLRKMQVSAFGGPADLRRGLLALWSAENNARDSVEGHHGTMMHGADFAEGKVGQAFHFASDQGRVYIPDAEDFALGGSFSFAAWVKTSDFNNNCLSQRGDDRPGNDPWVVTTVPDGRIAFTISSQDLATVSVSAPVTPNEWFHLACVYDGDAGQLRIYINGQLAEEKETSIRPIARLEPGMDPSVCLGNISGKFHRFPFRGLLDECALYARALSQADAQALTDLGNAGERIVPATASGN